MTTQILGFLDGRLVARTESKDGLYVELAIQRSGAMFRASARGRREGTQGTNRLLVRQLFSAVNMDLPERDTIKQIAKYEWAHAPITNPNSEVLRIVPIAETEDDRFEIRSIPGRFKAG